MNTRFVAVGDSLTQGRGDVHPDGQPRGFADLLALSLHARPGGVAYANLARSSVRTHEVLRDQVPAAVAATPDLVSVVAGVNDVIAVRFDAARVAGAMEAMMRTLREGCPDARIVTASLPDLSDVNLLARVWQDRVQAVNEAVWSSARRHGVEVVDLSRLGGLTREELAMDRIHPSPHGHLRIARAFGESLGVDVPEPAFMAGRPPAEGLRRVYRTVVVAPRFISRRLAREALIAAQPPKRPDPSPML